MMKVCFVVAIIKTNKKFVWCPGSRMVLDCIDF